MRKPRTQKSTKLGFEHLENRVVLSADPIVSSDSLSQESFQHGPGCACPGCCSAVDKNGFHSHMESDAVPFDEGWLGEHFQGAPPTEDVSNPLTIILDFNDPTQGLTLDGIGNQVTTFNVASFGFANNPGNFELVTNSVLAKVQEYFHDINTGLPSGEQLEVEFEIGDIGNAPLNGSNDFYYIQIGTDVNNTGFLGQAAIGAARNPLGIPLAPIGSVFGSVFTDTIQGMGFLTPSNALTTGNLAFSATAIANTTAHEIGHALSLLHIDTAGVSTPTGLPPVMATGAIDSPNQDNIVDNEFSISGQNSQAAGVTQRHIDQLEASVGTHDATLPFNASVTDVGYAYAFPASNGNIVSDTLSGDMNVNFPSDVDTTFFTPQFTGVHTIELSSMDAIEPVLGLYDAASGAKLAFDYGSSTLDAKLSVSLNAGQNYIIAGGDLQSDKTGDLVLEVTSPGTTSITTMNINANLQGTFNGILSAGEMEAHRVVTPNDSTGTMRVQMNANFTLDSVLVLWDTNGNEIMRQDNPGVGANEVITIGGTNPGDEYIVTVFASDYATSGSYSLDVEFSNSALPETLTTAEQGYAYAFPADTGDIVDNTTERNMFIGFGSDVDSVYFSPQNDGQHTIKVSNTNGSGVNPIVAIYDATTGQQLGIDNDSGPGDDAELTINLNAFQRYVIATGDVGANNAGSIRLRVETDSTMTVSDLFVASNGQAFATPFIGSGDVDAYRFVAPSGAYGDLNLSVNPGNGLDAVVVLWDADGNQLDRSDLFGNNTNEQVTTSGVAPGDLFYVTIFANDYASSDTANLLVEFDIFSPTQITVDQLTDENDGNTSNGDVSLREAILLSESNPGPDTIVFDSSLNGTINLSLGEMLITQPLLIDGPGADTLKIDAGGNSRIFNIGDGTNATGHDVEIRKLLLTGGAATGSADGGAIRSEESLTLRDSILTGNSSNNSGGALHAISNGSSETLIDKVQFINNTAIAGGAIDATRYGMTIVDSHFENNSSNYGGAIRGFNSNLAISESTFSGNVSLTAGGAIAMLSGTVSVTGSTFDDNSAGINYDGGAIYSQNSSQVTISESSFTNNSASDDGGAVAFEGSNADIVASLFSNNSAEEGGGIFSNNASLSLRDSTLANNQAFLGGGLRSRGSTTIVQTTISGNTADGPGGGIYSLNGPLKLLHSTVTNNVADANSTGTGRGGGIYRVFDSPVLDHTIVAGNFDNSGTAPDLGDGPVGGGAFDVQFSLIGESTGATVTDLGGSLIGNAASPIAPGLGPLADNGGDLPTHAPGLTSPVLDAGSNAFNANSFTPPLSSDQRGFPRVADADGTGTARIDIGATELPTAPSLPLTVDNPMDENDGDYSQGDLSLREAVLLANQSESVNLVRFAASMRGETIELTDGEISITDQLMLTSPSTSDYPIVDAIGLSRIFNIDDGNNQLDSPVTIERIAMKNGSTNTSGGGISTAESLTTRYVIMTDNVASNSGGAIYGYPTATLTINQSTLESNQADFGGAIRGTGISVVDSTLAYNSADYGGAIRTSGATRVESSTLHNNSTNNHGAGIDNAAGQLAVFNSTISHNASHWGGAAIWSHGGQHTLSIEHSTIVANTSDANNSGFGPGGGILMDNNRTATITNTILADNVDNSGSANNIIGRANVAYSFIGDGSGGNLTDNGGNQIGTSGSPLNPQLGPLVDNGGPTLTHHPAFGSPVIDAGDPLANSGGSPTFDQRNRLRFTDGDADGLATIDIGAVESLAIPASPLVVDLVADENDGRIDAGDLSLREAIEIANFIPGADTITFSAALSGETLTPDDIAITDSLTIVGLGQDQLTLDGQAVSRIFRIDDGDSQIDSPVLITDMTIANATSLVAGGAISSDEPLTVRNMKFDGNASDTSGGAIYSSIGPLIVEDSTFVSNHANFGGAILAKDLSVAASTFEANSADYGGALRVSGVTQIVDSLFFDNFTVHHGAAIDNSSGNVTVSNSTISGNRANWGGAAIWSHGGTHELAIYHSTIVNNESDANLSGFGPGGGILMDNGRTATLHHTIVADNIDNSGDAPNIDGRVVASYTMIGDNTGATITLDTGNQIGTAASPIDPQLEPLSDNGGPTRTHAPQTGSPIVDAGDPALLAGQGTTPQFDQRGSGFDRILNGNRGGSATIDIGAFESPAIVDFPAVAFAAARSDGQIELFRSNGMSGSGTGILKNIGGNQSSHPHELTIVGDDLFFAATGADSEVELFRTRANGSTTRVKDLAGSVSSNPHELIQFDDMLYFVATGPDGNTELYKSDGTNSGTVRVKNLSGATSSDPTNLTVMNGLLYFAATSETGQRELYVSDGTGPGTQRVRNLYGESQSSDPSDLTVVNDTLYFVATTPDGQRELHMSDGTNLGTTIVEDLSGATSSTPKSLIEFGDELYFVAHTEDGNSELHKSDGTIAGTGLVRDLYGPNVDASPRELTVLGSELAFVATTADGQAELHISDGTPAGTHLLTDLHGNTNSSPSELTVVDTHLYFSALGNDGERELYHSDGTANGTSRLKDIGGTTSSDPHELTGIDDTLYFAATLANGDTELFLSDGTAAGTKLVKNLGGDPKPHEIVKFDIHLGSESPTKNYPEGGLPFPFSNSQTRRLGRRATLHATDRIFERIDGDDAALFTI